VDETTKEQVKRLCSAVREMRERVVQLEQFQEALIVAMGPELGSRYRIELTTVQGERGARSSHDSLLRLIEEVESSL
jgi:hypothetical protein